LATRLLPAPLTGAHGSPPPAAHAVTQVPFFHRLFKSTGVHKAVFNEVEEPELLDDLK
jgi:hypothetical protein